MLTANDRSGIAPSRRRGERRTRRTRPSVSGGCARSSASSTRPSRCSPSTATTARRSTRSPSGRGAPGSRSTSTSPARTSCSGSSPDRWRGRCGPRPSPSTSSPPTPPVATRSGRGSVDTPRSTPGTKPVFRAFGPATQSDDALAGGSERAGARNIAVFQSKLATTTFPPRQLDPIVSLLLAGVTRTLDIAAILRAEHPDVYTRERVADSAADVAHRALFGLQPDVNDRPPAGPRVPRLADRRALRHGARAS